MITISTGIQIERKKICIEKAKHIGVQLNGLVKGKSEKGIVTKVDNNKAPGIKNNQTIIRVDKRYYRPSEVHDLLGDP